MFKLSFEFENPWFLLLLLILPFLYWQSNKPRFKKATMKISSLIAFRNTESLLFKIKPILNLLRYLALVLCIVALARPRDVEVSTKMKTDKGIDILLVVDTSLSMLAKDLKPSRISALKEVAGKFVAGKMTDRIGLVEYSGEALTRVPLTTDRKILIEAIEKLDAGVLESGTAIGIGLATAVNHLQNSKAKSKVIILMTDGVESISFQNDLMYVSPKVAANIAAEKEIKVYTIGIGTNGMAPFPVAYDMNGDFVFEMQPVEIDEDLLEYIAQKTKGRYFRATDNQSLSLIYQEIDQLEKSDINEVKYYNYKELYPYYLTWALLLLLIEFSLRQTLFKQLV